MPLFDGHILVRTQLRRAQRTADKPMADSIGLALQDDGYICDLAQSTLDTVQAANPSTEGAMRAIGDGTLIQAFIKAFIDNLPAILALIAQIFVIIPK